MLAGARAGASVPEQESLLHPILVVCTGREDAAGWQHKRAMETLPPMTQTSNRIFDDIAKLMTDAAGAAQGVRDDVETMMRSQGERILREMDVVPREEFEAVRLMAERARDENDSLRSRIEALERKLGMVAADES